MSYKKMEAIIRVRRGTYGQWLNSNPILEEGEISCVTSGQDEGKFKIGNGSTPWNNLPYSAARFPEDVLALTDQSASDALPVSGRIGELFQQIRNFLKWVKGLFDPSTGHRHNGTDSPRVSYNDLSDTSVIVNQINTVNDTLSQHIDLVDATLSDSKADKVFGVNGNFAALSASGNLVDSGKNAGNLGGGGGGGMSPTQLMNILSLNTVSQETATMVVSCANNSLVITIPRGVKYRYNHHIVLEYAINNNYGSFSFTLPMTTNTPFGNMSALMSHLYNNNIKLPCSGSLRTSGGHMFIATNVEAHRLSTNDLLLLIGGIFSDMNSVAIQTLYFPNNDIILHLDKITEV